MGAPAAGTLWKVLVEKGGLEAAEAALSILDRLGGTLARFTDYVEGIQNLAKVSQQIGINAKELEELRLAAELAGTEQATLDATLLSFARNISKAKSQSGETRDAFEDLGIEIEDLNTKTKVQLFKGVSKELAQVGDEYQRDQYLIKLFGEQGLQLYSILKVGGAQFDKHIEAARQLNEHDEALIEMSKEFGLVQTQLGAQLKDVGDSIATALLPILNELGRGLSAFLKKNKGDIKLFISNLGQLAISGFRAFSFLIEIIRKAYNLFAPVIDPILSITSALFALLNPLSLVLLLVDQFVSLLEGTESVALRLIESIRQSAAELAESITTALSFYKELIGSFLDWVWSGVTAGVEYLQQTLSGFRDWILGLILTVLVERIKTIFWDLFGEIIEKWKQDFLDRFGFITGVAESIGEKVRNIFDQVSRFKNLVGGFAGIGRTGVAAGTQLAMAGRPGAAVNTQQNEISVAVQAAPGMSEERLATEVSRKIGEELERQYRTAFQAHTPQTAGT